MEKEQKITKAELARRKREEKACGRAGTDRSPVRNLKKNTITAGISVALMKQAEVRFAGPVVAGAVVLPKGCRILYINDSKKLSEKSVKNSLTLSAVKQSV